MPRLLKSRRRLQSVEEPGPEGAHRSSPVLRGRLMMPTPNLAALGLLEEPSPNRFLRTRGRSRGLYRWAISWLPLARPSEGRWGLQMMTRWQKRRVMAPTWAPPRPNQGYVRPRVSVVGARAASKYEACSSPSPPSTCRAG